MHITFTSSDIYEAAKFNSLTKKFHFEPRVIETHGFYYEVGAKVIDYLSKRRLRHFERHEKCIIRITETQILIPTKIFRNRKYDRNKNRLRECQPMYNNKQVFLPLRDGVTKQIYAFTTKAEIVRKRFRTVKF